MHKQRANRQIRGVKTERTFAHDGFCADGQAKGAVCRKVVVIGKS